LKIISVHAHQLIPTDYPRTLMGILRFIPMIFADEEIDPVVLVLRSSPEPGEPQYFICSGNHRAAAAFICGCDITAVVVESKEDLSRICEGRVARCRSIMDLEQECREEANSGRYLKGGWEEYLRMVTDSGVVNFEDPDGPGINEFDLQRRSR